MVQARDGRPFDPSDYSLDTPVNTPRPFGVEHASAEYGALTAGDWRQAIADAHARIDACERRTLDIVNGLAHRVDLVATEVDALRCGNDGSMRDLERRIVELSDRVGRIEARKTRSDRRN